MYRSTPEGKSSKPNTTSSIVHNLGLSDIISIFNSRVFIAASSTPRAIGRSNRRCFPSSKPGGVHKDHFDVKIPKMQEFDIANR